jgi:hypothetical protein
MKLEQTVSYMVIILVSSKWIEYGLTTNNALK